jgi:hypothetical protein
MASRRRVSVTILPMGETSELRVPIRPVPVELAMVGQRPEAAELFLAGRFPDSRSRLAAEVAALLEDDGVFLPVSAGGSFSLCNKGAIAWVALIATSAPAIMPPSGASHGDGVPEPVESAEPSEVVTLYDHRHDVRIELEGGTFVDGHVLYSSPEGGQRVVDHLNRAGRFLWLWQGTTLYLISKQHVVRVRERDR